MNNEQRLFKAVHKIGEGIFDGVHILDHTQHHDKIEYRVYHSGGYCWDISMEEQFPEDDDTADIEPYFEFSENWDGFKESGIEFAIKAIESIKT